MDELDQQNVFIIFILSFSIINFIHFSASTAIEGWIIFVRNIHPEAQEDDIVDRFSEFGDVKGIQVNLDRRTGYVKVTINLYFLFLCNSSYELPLHNS